MNKHEFDERRKELVNIIESKKSELTRLEFDFARELFYSSLMSLQKEEVEKKLKDCNYDFYYMLSNSIVEEEEEEEALISIRKEKNGVSYSFGIFNKNEFFDVVYAILIRFNAFMREE